MILSVIDKRAPLTEDIALAVVAVALVRFSGPGSGNGRRNGCRTPLQSPTIPTIITIPPTARLEAKVIVTFLICCLFRCWTLFMMRISNGIPYACMPGYLCNKFKIAFDFKFRRKCRVKVTEL